MSNEQSFAQGTDVVCYCCGKKGHKSPDCPDKDKIPKEKWYQNMAYQNYVKAMKGEGNDDSPNESNKGRSGRRSTAWSGLHVDEECSQQDYSLVHRSVTKEMEDYIT